MQWRTNAPTPVPDPSERERSPQRRPRLKPEAALLYLAGVLLALAALLFTVYVVLNTWLMDQDRYLVAGGAESGSRPPITRTAPVIPTPTPGADVPVHILIPALDVERSVIGLPQVQDSRTGAWVRDVKRLWRSGRNDMVGHWGGSAYPGQEGNMVLVGHNYGYGQEGAFLHIGRLKPGQVVQVATALGTLHTYRVTAVERVKWGVKDSAELARHTSLLATGGEERLTLVTCSGAGVAPFAERIYVLADPAEASE